MYSARNHRLKCLTIVARKWLASDQTPIVCQSVMNKHRHDLSKRHRTGFVKRHLPHVVSKLNFYSVAYVLDLNLYNTLSGWNMHPNRIAPSTEEHLNIEPRLLGRQYSRPTRLEEHHCSTIAVDRIHEDVSLSAIRTRETTTESLG